MASQTRIRPPPSGAAGGALDGTYPNPGIAASVAGAGLTETSDVLAVGAGHGLDVTADAVDVDESELNFATGATITGTNATGAANTLARSDHNHALPSYGTTFAYLGAGTHNSAAPGANQQYYGQIVVLHQVTLTGIGYWVGAVQNGNVKVGLFNSSGTKVAETTGTVGQAGANTFQQVAFASTYAAAPGQYYAGIILSSATGTWYRGSTPLGPYGNNAPGSFAIGASITPPTAPASTNMPFLVTY